MTTASGAREKRVTAGAWLVRPSAAQSVRLRVSVPTRMSASDATASPIPRLKAVPPVPQVARQSQRAGPRSAAVVNDPSLPLKLARHLQLLTRIDFSVGAIVPAW